MAFKDSSGRITIDEYAADQDIKRINQAINSLNDSKRALENMINQASGEKGATAVAIVEKANEMKKQIESMINRLNETSSFISRTIAHYREVDRQVKEAIQNSMRAAASASTPAPSKQVSSSASTPAPTQSNTKSKTSKTTTTKKTSSTSKKSSSKKDDDDNIWDTVFGWFK